MPEQEQLPQISVTQVSAGKKDKKMAKSSTKKRPIELVAPTKKEKTAKVSQIGSPRGIESMFRNSYRAQLDMIALAATKANIMISLNGLLVSVLLISGAYFLGTEPMLIVPFAAFLVTCTVATVFAVLAARPVADRAERSIDDFRTWIKRIFSSSSSSRNFRRKRTMSTRCLEMLRNNDRVYRNMIVHIHSLGLRGEPKVRPALTSPTVTFMIGLVISVILALRRESAKSAVIGSLSSCWSFFRAIRLAPWADISVHCPLAVRLRC